MRYQAYPEQTPLTLPEGYYIRYQGSEDQGFMMKCLSFDPDVATLLEYLSRRGLYLTTSFDADYSVSGNRIGDTSSLVSYPDSSYGDALHEIQTLEQSGQLEEGSHEAACMALVAGEFEQTEWVQYVKHPVLDT